VDETAALTTSRRDSSLDLTLAAWLDAKFHRSTSEKTRKAYTDTLQQFRAGLQRQGLDLDGEPSTVALMAQAFASFSARGKQVKPATYNQRLAILSSFYEYARKRKVLSSNPIETLERAKVQEYASAQALDGEMVRESLQAIDQSTLRGARDYAILTIFLQTGRRAQEVARLQWQHVSMHKEKARLTFEHAKGGLVMQDELPVRVTNALMRWLQRWYGTELGKLPSEAPLWVSLAHDASYGRPLGYQSINALCKKHLGTSKVHATRHTWAHSMEQLGASVSEIQARLGHKSLATTGRYLASLRRAENRKAEELATLFGIE
jgi:integrase